MKQCFTYDAYLYHIHCCIFLTSYCIISDYYYCVSCMCLLKFYFHIRFNGWSVLLVGCRLIPSNLNFNQPNFREFNRRLFRRLRWSSIPTYPTFAFIGPNEAAVLRGGYSAPFGAEMHPMSSQLLLDEQNRVLKRQMSCPIHVSSARFTVFVLSMGAKAKRVVSIKDMSGLT